MPAKCTTVELIQHVTLTAGRDPALVRTLQRYLREAGIHEPALRGGNPPPQIENVHATTLLMACLIGGTQSIVAQQLTTLWQLPTRDHAQGLLDGFDEIGISAPAPATFGRFMYALMEMGTRRSGAVWLQGNLKRITVEHSSAATMMGPDYASIEVGADRLEFVLPLIRQDRARMQSKGAIVETRGMLARPLIDIAKFVALSRQEARLISGYTISEAKAFRVLERQPQELPDLSAEGDQENTHTSESKEAVEAPPSTASSNGQPARTRTSPAHTESNTRTRTPKATPSGRVDRSRPRTREGGSGHDGPKQLANA